MLSIFFFRSDRYIQLPWPVLLTQYLIVSQRSKNILVINFLDRSFSDWICQLKQTMFGPEDTSGKSKQPFHCLLLEYSQTKLTIYNVQCMAKFERRIIIIIGVYRTLRGLGWSLKIFSCLDKEEMSNNRMRTHRSLFLTSIWMNGLQIENSGQRRDVARLNEAAGTDDG